MSEAEPKGFFENKDSTAREEEKKYNYDAIVVLSGAIRKHDRLGWRTTAYSEGDDYGSLGGRIRVIAAEYLYKQGDVARNILAVTGKPDYLKKEAEEPPAESEQIKKELVGRGIPEDSIFTEIKSKNTKQNFEELFNAAKNNGWGRIVILTNRYHVPRSKAFCEKFQKENPIYTGIEVDFISAEDVLIDAEPRWEDLINEAYKNPEMVKRLENELKGQWALESGRYSSIQGNSKDKD